MSSISTAVQLVLQARRDATQTKIDAINQMIGQIQSVQKQLGFRKGPN